MKTKINFLNAVGKKRYLALLLTLMCVLPQVWGGMLVEGFETKSPGTDYQSTVTVSTSESDCGLGWEIYYGTVSTADKNEGDQGAQMRLYYNKNNYGYLKTTTAITNLTSISFWAKAGTGKSAVVKIDVKYSTNAGSTWSYMKMESPTGSNYSLQTPSPDGSVYTAYVPSDVTGDFLVGFFINSSSTKPTSDNVAFTVDNVMFSTGSDVYTLVDDVLGLASGDEIIILNNDCSKALGSTQNPNNRSASADFSLSDNNNVVTVTANTVQPILLRSSNSYWTLYANQGYLYAAGSGSGNNHLKSRVANSDGDSEWSISISDDIATITAQGTHTNKVLKYNTSGSGLFSCYSSGQKDVKIYKRLTAKCDIFVDVMHDRAIARQVGSYTMPDLSDETPGSYCVGQHYKFVGWVEESDLNDDGTLKDGYTLIRPGTVMEADLTTYYAIWAKDVE